MSDFSRKQDNSGACWFCGQAISDLACGNCGNCDNGRRKDKLKKSKPTYAELEAENKALLTLLQDMTDAGMVPTTSASDGGASKYSRAVRIADRVRAALTKEEL